MRKQRPVKYLGVFSLVMMNVAAIISLRNLPILSQSGLASLSFYLLAVVLFFFPVALVCAELAAAYPGKGGVYRWIKEAFGARVAFIIIWASWIGIIAWFPAILSFIAVMVAYVIEPSLAYNQYFLFLVTVVVFWSSTLLNFLGVKTSSSVSALGVILGTIMPGSLIIILGLYWLFFSDNISMELSMAALIPELSLDSFVMLSGVLLGFVGVEVSSFHATETRDPQNDYPKAILISSLIIVVLFVLGTLSISIVVPKEELSILSGMMQTFDKFFNYFDIGFAVPFVAVMSALGAFAAVNTWVVGPAKGLLAAGEDGFLPEFLSKVNKHGVPVNILFMQVSIGTALSFILLFMPNVESAYWMFVAVSSQFALILYLTLLQAAVKLRKLQPTHPRPFKAIKSDLGLTILVSISSVVCAVVFLISFLPAEQLKITNSVAYTAVLCVIMLVLGGLPVFLTYLRKANIHR